MRKVGLLMETDIQDPDDQTKIVTLSQFVHLSIQEFLAMAGLLKEDLEVLQNTLKRLCASEQLTMALLFLYGLAFNEENSVIKNISMAEDNPSAQKADVLHALTAGITVSITLKGNDN